MSKKWLKDIISEELNNVLTKYNDPNLFINREMSWLEFNMRVLHQSTRSDVPLLERLKFLSITESNLDEFIMVRLSSVINKLRRGEIGVDIAGLTARQEYAQVLKGIKEFKAAQQDQYRSLIKKLGKRGIQISRLKDLTKKETEYVDRLFLKNIYPLLTPIAIDATKELPLIKSKQLNMVVALEDSGGRQIVAIIPIDNGLERLYRVDGDSKTPRYVLLEDIVRRHLSWLFVNKKIIYVGCMKILREADIELVGSDDVYLIDRMRETIDRREKSDPIFMDVSGDIPKDVLKILTKIFKIKKGQVYRTQNIVGLSLFASKPIRNAAYEYKHFTPQYPEVFTGEHDMFTAIDSGDIILHHPYESFVPVIKFLEHASMDKDVLAIKQTLYRVSSSESPIVESLCRAAQNGKQVSVLLEIKARFDEDRNMSLIDKLKDAGCKIIFGDARLKTHAKFIVVVKKGRKGLKTYCHMSTGNYNDKTATIYTDISYFTANNKIGEDLIGIFNILSGYSEPKDFITRLQYAPYNLRSTIYELIDREIEFAKSGKKALISLKLNSLSDAGVIKKLYEAARKGVKISILCRGICSMRPISNNITITSLVGRYLEHSRIYYFHNGGDTEIFISSADMLTRNLDRRVELLIPIYDPQSKNKLLDILKYYTRDTFNTYIMDEKGAYSRVGSKDDDTINIHDVFMDDALRTFKTKSLPKMSNRK